jgi:hypothetical protein
MVGKPDQAMAPSAVMAGDDRTHRREDDGTSTVFPV